MPEPRTRKKTTYTPPARRTPQKVQTSPPWLAPAMVACFVVGLLWIVVYYLAGQDIPGMRNLANWNLGIGMGLIITGFILMTQWK